MDKVNSIKRATSTDVQENKKKNIKSFRAEIYDYLDKKKYGKNNAFSNHKKDDVRNKQMQTKDDEKSQKR